MDYTVTNIGAGRTLTGSWSDVVYLSPDTVLDYSGRHPPWQGSTGFPPSRRVKATPGRFPPVLPEGISGDFYVIVADRQRIGRSPMSTRRTTCGVTALPGDHHAVAVSRPPARTLVAPPGGQAGQPVTVTWAVANTGAGIPAGRSVDRRTLPVDAMRRSTSGDARLGSLERAGPLPERRRRTPTRWKSILPELRVGDLLPPRERRHPERRLRT